MVIASGVASQHGHDVDGFIYCTERLYVHCLWWVAWSNPASEVVWVIVHVVGAYHYCRHSGSWRTCTFRFSICWCWGGGDIVFWRMLPVDLFITAKGVTPPKGTWIYNKTVKEISKYFKEKELLIWIRNKTSMHISSSSLVTEKKRKGKGNRQSNFCLCVQANKQ
jgi:hypothetical protein